MSIEGAKRLAIDGVAFGEEGVKRFAARMLEELETHEEHARRVARERQAKWRRENGAREGPDPPDPEPEMSRSERDAGVTDPAPPVTPMSRENGAKRDICVTRPVARARTQDPDLSLDLSRFQDLKGSGSLGGGTGEPFALVTPSQPPRDVTKTKPKKRRRQPSPPPGPEDEIAWAMTWQIPYEHSDFAHFLDHHRRDEIHWRDWAAAWRTWLRKGSTFAQRASGPRLVAAPRSTQDIADEAEQKRRKHQADEEYRVRELARLNAQGGHHG
jgi:hypothetical protein